MRKRVTYKFTSKWGKCPYVSCCDVVETFFPPHILDRLWAGNPSVGSVQIKIEGLGWASYAQIKWKTFLVSSHFFRLKFYTLLKWQPQLVGNMAYSFLFSRLFHIILCLTVFRSTAVQTCCERPVTYMEADLMALSTFDLMPRRFWVLFICLSVLSFRILHLLVSQPQWRLELS